MVVVCLVLCYMQHMAVGRSGRIVLEIEPAVKRALHARLAGDGRSLKDWFLEQVDVYLSPKQQLLPLIDTGPRRADPPSLKAADSASVPWSTKRGKR